MIFNLFNFYYSKDLNWKIKYIRYYMKDFYEYLRYLIKEIYSKLILKNKINEPKLL